MSENRLVYIIRKENEHISDSQKLVTNLVLRHQDIKEIDFKQAIELDFSESIMLIVDVELDDYQTIMSLKNILSKPRENNIPLFFIIGTMNRKEIIQAHTLGATEFISHPVNEKEFTKKLKNIANKSIENSWKSLSKTSEAALKVSLKIFEDTFSGAGQGRKLSDKVLGESCELIIEATEKGELSSMLTAIRTHHNYTYRHSMMVSGYLTAFGLLFGIRNFDLRNLTSCGLVHDIGKALISQEILNKPGPLTEDEWTEMKLHPSHSRQVLSDGKFHPDIIDGAVHHHERIDGTGYPDRLIGSEVSDMARMVAIADVFSGLTEKRSYKPSMSNLKAYEIMQTMEGHLDLHLLNAFKPIALG
ncbi:MAG: HD domain-containing protein [Emcibacteraceae bacterium]